MDETHIDDTYQEDGSVDDIALLQAQYTRIRTLESLSVLSDDNARAVSVPSSPTRSPLHLTSLSSEPLRSPVTITLLLRSRSELLRSQQEIAMGVRGFRGSHSSRPW